MIRIRDLALAPGEDTAALRRLAAKALRISDREIEELQIRRRSIDARKKEQLRIVYPVDVRVAGN